MKRTLSVNNVLDKKHQKYEFDGVFETVLGSPSKGGVWLIYGKEKNGKTWGTLLLSDYLSQFDKVLYVSAEEGIDTAFQDAIIRAKIDPKNRGIKFLEYTPLEELIGHLKKQRSPKVVVLDNLTVYNDEITSVVIKELIRKYPKVLFIMVAHEEKGQPYLSNANTASKLAKIIIRVQGLSLRVSGRCPGGYLHIDEQKAMLYHGKTT